MNMICHNQLYKKNYSIFRNKFINDLSLHTIKVESKLMYRIIGLKMVDGIRKDNITTETISNR